MSWTTRQLHDRGHRYTSAKPGEEAVPHKELLYGEWMCRNAVVVVVEGATDAWRVGAGAVATMGLSVTPAQVEKLSRYYRRVICFDSTGDAQRRASKLADRLACFEGETLIVRLDAADPGSAGVHEIKQLREYLR